MANRTIRTPKKRAAFLAVLREGYSIHRACKAASIGRQSAYDWRDADEVFAKDWDAAVEAGTDELEDALHERAANTDTTAAIFLLKGRRPEKYRERTDSRVSGDVTVNISRFSEDKPSE